MKLVDANVLLYAVNEDTVHHERSKAWLDSALSGGATVAFAWSVLMAFLRLATKSSIFPQPMLVAEAAKQVEDWLSQTPAVVVEPTARHLGIMASLFEEVGVGGDLVSDVHLAALAVEHRCDVVTFDTDFKRFAQIRAEAPA